MRILIALCFYLPILAWSFVLPDQVIITQDHSQFFDLSGASGRDGINGQDAYGINCEDHPWQVIDGINGEMGLSGEDGADGEDVIIRYQGLAELSDITLINPGGSGGKPGLGGRGTIGCNGGAPGNPGRAGKPGENGEYGRVFLVPQRTLLPEVNPTQIITLEELLKNKTKLSYIKWASNFGLQDLLNPASDVSQEFYTFKGVVEKTIQVRWLANQPGTDFLQTRLGLHLASDGLHINNYRGPFLRYRIEETPESSTIIIEHAIREDSLANLKLGKMRNSMFDLILEVKRKYDLIVPLRTLFNISIFEVDENNLNLALVGHFNLPDELVQFDEDKFQIYIGKLNYPMQYKRRGVKLRVYLSVTRENDNQRRTYVLKGLYRI